jgi:Fe-S cluster biogenesis protein NfuA
MILPPPGHEGGTWEPMMMETLDAREFQSRLQRLDALLCEVEESADPASAARTREIVQAVLDLHGTGLERILGHVESAGEGGAAILDACVEDDVVGGLLLLHGLHPMDLEARVLRALERVRPALRSHGGNVELVEVRDGVVRLRLEGNCHGCPSSAATMKMTIEEVVFANAPEVASIEVQGLTDRQLTTPDGRALVTLSVL